MAFEELAEKWAGASAVSFGGRDSYTPRLKDLQSQPWRRGVYTAQRTVNDNGAQYTLCLDGIVNYTITTVIIEEAFYGVP